MQWDDSLSNKVMFLSKGFEIVADIHHSDEELRRDPGDARDAR
jgi:hypothetical protein